MEKGPIQSQESREIITNENVREILSHVAWGRVGNVSEGVKNTLEKLGIQVPTASGEKKPATLEDATVYRDALIARNEINGSIEMQRAREAFTNLN